jgi:hypothetical protein
MAFPPGEQRNFFTVRLLLLHRWLGFRRGEAHRCNFAA